MAGTRGPRSWRVALTGAAWAWVLLLVVSPGWAGQSGAGPRSAAAVVRLIGAQVCHQRPERSFHLHGRPLAVCGRCTGVYASAAVGLLAGGLSRRRRRDAGHAGVLGVAAAPTLITWALEVAGLWNPGTPLRALAALPLGLAAGWFIARALDE